MGVAEFGLTGPLVQTVIPTGCSTGTTTASHVVTTVNPTGGSSQLADFAHGVHSGFTLESHQLLGQAADAAPVNAAHAGAFSGGSWVGDKIVDKATTGVIGSGLPWLLDYASNHQNIPKKKERHWGWWCVECEVRLPPCFHASTLNRL